MSVRETLELDISRALAQANQLGASISKQLSDAGAALDKSLAQAAGQLRGTAGPIDNMAAGLRGAGTEAGRLAGGLTTLGPEADKAAAGMFRYQQSVLEAREAERQANQQRRETEQSLSKVGNAAGIAGAAILAGLGLATHATMGFDKELSMLGAVSGATAGQMDRLRQSALDAGAATVFSASDAARAQTELAKAGVSTADILGGGLAGALNLASAGQLDLGRAAEISAQAMTTFGMRGRDVAHIADVLAAGANKSTASVESLAQGLENVGGVAAKLFNVSLEETVGTLALFDQNAIRGAEGGTALRSALLALATPSQVQASLIADIAMQTGVTITEFDSLAGLAGNLQRAFAGMDDEQRRFAMGVLFGTYGIRAANVLYAEGEAGVRKWTTAVNDSGAAQRFASTAMNNLAGDIEEFRGAVETGLIGAGSQANEVLRFMAQRGTEAVRGLAGLPGPAQAAGFGLASVSAAGLGAVFVLGSLIPKWRELDSALRNAGSAGTFAANNMGSFLRVAAGAAGAVTSFQMIGQSAEASAIGVAGLAASGALIGSAFAPGAGTAVGAAIGGLVGLGKAMFSAGESAEQFGRKVDGLAQKLTGLGERAAARAFLDEVGESASDMARNFELAGGRVEDFLGKAGFVGRSYSDIAGMIARAGDQVSEFERKFAALAAKAPAQAEVLLAGLRGLRNEAGKPIIPPEVIAGLEAALERGEQKYAKFQQRSAEAGETNRKIAGDLAGTTDGLGLQAGAADDAAKAWEKYTDALSQGAPTVNGVFADAANAVKDWQNASSPEQLLNNLRAQFEGVANFASNIQHLVSVGLTDLAAHLVQMGPQAGGAIAQAIRDASPEMQQELENMLDLGSTEIANWAGWLSGPGAELLRNSSYGLGMGVGTGAAGGVAASAPSVHDQFDQLTVEAIARLAPLPAAGHAAGAGASAGVAWGVEGGKGAVETATGSMADRVRSVLGALPGDAHGTGENVSYGLAEGIAAAEGAALAAARALAGQVKSVLRSARDGFAVESPSKITRQYGEWVVEGLALGMRDATPLAVGAAAGMARSVEDQLAASLQRIARNAELGINVGNLPVPEGYVSAPVGVRSSALWTQEMVDAYEAARPLAEKIAMASDELARAQARLEQANLEAWMSGINGASDEVMRTAVQAAEVAQRAVDEVQARLDALNSGTGTGAGVAGIVAPDDTALEEATINRDLLAALQESVSVEKSIYEALTAQPLPVIVTKLPDLRPTVQIGELRVDVTVPAGADSGAVKQAARAGVDAALSTDLGNGLSIKSIVATIGAL